MAIKKEKKEELVQQYTNLLNSSSAVFMVQCSGATVAEMEKLRNAMVQEKSDLVVVRNRLLGLVAEKAGQSALADSFQGATLVAFCQGDPTSPAKTIVNVTKDIEDLKLYGGTLSGKWIDAEHVQALANMPSREIMIGRVLGTLQSPIAGFVGVLNGTLRSLLYALQARADQLQAPASTEAA